MSIGKVMAFVFWDAHGIILMNYHKKNINGEYYTALLERLKAEIALKLLQMKEKKVLFRQGNASDQKPVVTMAKLYEQRLLTVTRTQENSLRKEILMKL